MVKKLNQVRILVLFGKSHHETKVSISHSDGCGVSFAYSYTDTLFIGNSYNM